MGLWYCVVPLPCFGEYIRRNRVMAIIDRDYMLSYSPTKPSSDVRRKITRVSPGHSATLILQQRDSMLHKGLPLSCLSTLILVKAFSPSTEIQEIGMCSGLLMMRAHDFVSKEQFDGMAWRRPISFDGRSAKQQYHRCSS